MGMFILTLTDDRECVEPGPENEPVLLEIMEEEEEGVERDPRPPSVTSCHNINMVISTSIIIVPHIKHTSNRYEKSNIKKTLVR